MCLIDPQVRELLLSLIALTTTITAMLTARIRRDQKNGGSDG
jgi:hypothetical protein